MRKFLIVGRGGRESAFALKLIEDAILYAVSGHENPTITDSVRQSGGAYLIGNANDPEVVLNFTKKHEVDIVFVSADEPLANGVVDVLLENNIKAVGATRDAARIEWDKIYSMEMMQEICPQFTPFYRVVSRQDELQESVQTFINKNLQIAVKPQGLTGGKGVKVMPEHLQTYQDAIEYAAKLLKDNPAEKVLLVEKLQGIEFTIMGLTDGENLVLSPASYDYPFRYEDDLGAGTGGMGCFTAAEKTLPFMDKEDLRDCKDIMQKIIDNMRRKNLPFNGVLNGGFFKTSKGIKFMEFNGRFGDPEALNVLSVLQGSFAELLKNIYEKNINEQNVRFIKKASVVKYLVAKEYPDKSDVSVKFTVDEESIKAMGINLYFASCIRTGEGRYETLKKSRVVALGAVSETIENASDMINEAIQKYVAGNLEYRRDIGAKKSLDKLQNTKMYRD